MPDKKAGSENWRRIIAGTQETEILSTSVKPGTTYLVKETGIERSIELFRGLINKGVSGLVITRMHPEKLKALYNLQNTEILWLTTSTEYKDRINPNDLSFASHTVNQFIISNKGGVILFDGLEYITTQNSYELALKFVQSLNDAIASRNNVVLIPIDSNTFDTKQLSLLESECEVIEPQPAENATKTARGGLVHEKTSRDLLRLLLKTGGMEASKASKMLGVERGTLERWIILLQRKGVITRKGPQVDPFLEVTPVFIERLRAMKKSKPPVIDRDSMKKVQNRSDF